MATDNPELILEQGARVIASAHLDGPTPPPITVEETHAFGLHLSHAESELEYRLRIGGVPIEWAFEGVEDTQDPASGSRIRDQVFWPEGTHFDGACGATWVILESRPLLREGEWVRRAAIPVDVVPSKLGRARYDAMVAELRALSPELVYDHTGKSARDDATSGPPSLSDALAALEETWRDARSALRRIARTGHPAIPPGVTRRLPADARSARDIDALVRRGIDPRHGATPASATGIAWRVASDAPPEVRSVVAILTRMETRVADITRRARAEVERLDRHRDYRDVRIGPRRSIYELLDRPHVERMENVRSRASSLRRELRAMRMSPPLRGVSADRRIPATLPVSAAPPVHALVRILADSPFRSRTAEYVKTTSRMYEQWVFLQLLAAFRARGLEDEEPVVARANRGLDVDRNRVHAFRVGGRLLRLHYEPWIHPIDLAAERRDPLYREGGEATSWSPDVLIERVRPHPAGDIVEAAIVVDAKYTLVPGPSHWNRTAKYISIRERRTGRPVVRQVWLACPTSGGRLLRVDPPETADEISLWPASQRYGVLELTPPSAFDARSGPFTNPLDAAVRFAGRVMEELEL